MNVLLNSGYLSLDFFQVVSKLWQSFKSTWLVRVKMSHRVPRVSLLNNFVKNYIELGWRYTTSGIGSDQGWQLIFRLKTNPLSIRAWTQYREKPSAVGSTCCQVAFTFNLTRWASQWKTGWHFIGKIISHQEVFLTSQTAAAVDSDTTW